MNTPTYIAITLLLLPFNYVICGWTITVLWAWFIAAPFGARELNLALAIGIGTLVSFVASKPDLNLKNLSHHERLKHFASLTFVRPPAVLGGAWIVKQFL